MNSLRSFLILLFLHVSYAVQCPAGLPEDSNTIVNGSKCYEFVLHHRNDWAFALGDCAKKGGNLVTIENMDEQNFIMTALHNLKFTAKGVWIGLTDRKIEGRFVWVEGNKPANFTNWAPGQPGSVFPLNEDCVLLMYHHSGRWHDYHCFDEFLFLSEHDGWICQYGTQKPNASTPLVTSQTSTMTTKTKTSKKQTSVPTTMAATSTVPTTMAATSTVPTTMAAISTVPTTMAATSTVPTTMAAISTVPTTMAASSTVPTTIADTSTVPTTMAVISTKTTTQPEPFIIG